MNFLLTEDRENLEDGLRILLQQQGHSYGEGGMKIMPLPTTENILTVKRDGDTVLISFGQRAHFFRGVGHLLSRLSKMQDAVSDMEQARNEVAISKAHHCDLPEALFQSEIGLQLRQNCENAPFKEVGVSTTELNGEIREKAYMDSLGLMVDCSRNGVPSLDTLKELIHMEALLGMNELLLYMEEVYELPGYPYFGAYRGRYTREELQECDRYAAMFGIEVIPCIQTLAHMKSFLRWEDSRPLADTDDILLAGEEKVYELIDTMLHTLSAIFSTPKIHLGMDEAHNLGRGTYLDKHGYKSQIPIMKDHLKRVMKLCKKYNYNPMIWSDMYFYEPSKTGTYYGVDPSYEWPVEDKPESSLTMVYWDYYSHEKSDYEKMVRLHKKLTDHICFAGGCWTWNGIAPNYGKAFDTTEIAMKVMREQGVRRAFTTL